MKSRRQITRDRTAATQERRAKQIRQAMMFGASCGVNADGLRAFALGLPETKPNNPKDSIAIRKAYLSTVPLPVIMEMGLGMLDGGCKYGRHNYREVGTLASVQFDACARHLFDWWEGEDIDQDSMLHHITKLLTSACVLRDAILQGKLTDDRPPPSPAGWMRRCNEKAGQILDRYPNPKPAHTRVKAKETAVKRRKK